VEALAGRLTGVPHAPAVSAARRAIDERRELLRGGSLTTDEPDGPSPATAVLDELVVRAHAIAAETARASLRPVVNATGVIVHTNLGRAPLPSRAVEAVNAVAGGYSNLELDLADGGRGSRQTHVEGLVAELTGAEAGLVVNNCAAAVLLAAAALAAGREIVVSRGQLVEIGGSFRIPEVVEQSGAALVEVGTTNRTRLADYARALAPNTGAVLRAHPSNFRTVGFVEEVEIEPLCALAAESGVPVIDDVGSGAVAERVPELADEPSVRRSVTAGCALTCFSGDKLLGGPQAGILAGTAEAVDACRRHPLARALRIDKLSLAALEATLRLYRDPTAALREIPVLRMLAGGEGELQGRAEEMRSALESSGVDSTVVRAAAKVGGGALPLLELEGPVCAVDPGGVGLDELARRLRLGEPPVIGRAREGWLLLDPRTLDDESASAAVAGVAAALRP